MNNRHLFSCLLLSLLLTNPGMGEPTKPVKIKIQGSTTVNPIMTEVAEILTREKGWIIFVDTQGGSSGGVSALGEGLVDIGMISKPIGQDDRTKYPHTNFTSHAIGLDGVGIVVSKPIWMGGVHSLDKKQIQYLYEGKFKNWQDVGGPNAPVVFYNKEPGRGTWEVFADWVYNGHKNAPLVSLPEVGANEEARNKVSHHPSAITQLSYAWAEGSDKIQVVGIKNEDGKIVLPSLDTIRNGDYPLARTLYLITNGPPIGPIKELIDFVLSPRGQALVKKHGYLPKH